MECKEHGTWMDAGEAELVRKLNAFHRALKTARAQIAQEMAVAGAAHAAEQAAAEAARVAARNEDSVTMGGVFLDLLGD